MALRRSVLALPSAADTASPTLNDSVRALSDEDLKSQLQTFCVLHASNVSKKLILINYYSTVFVTKLFFY